LQPEEERIDRVKVPSDYTKEKLEHAFTSVGWVLKKGTDDQIPTVMIEVLRFHNLGSKKPKDPVLIYNQLCSQFESNKTLNPKTVGSFVKSSGSLRVCEITRTDSSLIPIFSKEPEPAVL
jgi:hypothetical protein